MKILLNKKQSKTSRNVKNSLLLNFMGSRKLLPNEPIKQLVDEYEEYLAEREPCTKIRLTCAVNAICSNVLFNNLTEVVKDEGSSDVSVYKGEVINDLYGKNTISNVTKDTQLSRPSLGYKYHCGIDIFNNHTLRSNTFSSIAPLSTKSKDNINFNTIEDLDRNYKGEKIEQYFGRKGKSKEKHVYGLDTLFSFEDCVSKKLIEENGWFGFNNVSKFPMFKTEGGVKDVDEDDEFIGFDEEKYRKYDFSNTINYRNGGDFIDLSPERDLFSFSPKFNKFRNRIEKNWNYCITYPSSSTTDIDFIDDETNGLKAIFYDEFTTSSNMRGIKIYSFSKHGLDVGDYVNVYVESALTLNNVRVLEVEDEFVFTVYANNTILSDEWYTVDELKESGYTLSEDRKTITNPDKTETYYIINNKVNLNDNETISYKRVVGGMECDYYVRLFSRLPNWRFKTEEPTFYNLYEDENSTLLRDFSTYENEFESHVGKLAFAKNIYGDDLGEIVFNDTLDIDKLRDNLGRPLTSLYLTIIKNNSGYKEWYKDENYGDESVEYSHVFGKVNCAFRLSEQSLVDKNSKNVTRIHNLESGVSGLNVAMFRNEEGENDEILYKEDMFFYGDLCCYSKYTCDEMIVEPVEFRFNTAQRELGIGDALVAHDEIVSDDFDDNFEVKEKKYDNSVLRKEGYCYIPHYEIQVRTFSTELSSAYPIFYKVRNVAYNENELVIQTMNACQLRKNQEFYIYLKDTRERYKLQVKDVIGIKKFTVSNENLPSGITPTNVILFVADKEEIPFYATFVSDGSCRYYWREVKQNGFDLENQNEEYPFANGHLYINKNFNLYLKRQDPKGVNGLWSGDYPYSFESKLMNPKYDNNYYNSDDISC